MQAYGEAMNIVLFGSQIIGNNKSGSVFPSKATVTEMPMTSDYDSLDKEALDNADVYICNLKPADNFADIFLQIKGNHPGKPFIFLGVKNKKLVDLFSGDLYTAFLSFNNSEHVLSQTIEKLLSQKNTQAFLSERYSRIPVNELFSFDQIDGDLFISLSSNKFVKVIHANSKDFQSELKEYYVKGVRYLYLKESDFKRLAIQFMDESDSSYGKDIRLAADFNLTEEFDYVHQCIQSIGINEKTIKKVNGLLNESFKVINKSKDLEEYFRRLNNSGDFLIEHSLILGYVTRHSLEYFESSSMGAGEYLFMASLFHDMTLSHGHVERTFINGSNEDQIEVPRNLVKEYEQHTLSAMDLVSSVRDINPAVIQIIGMHHERMNGTGFPRGLDYKTIPPLPSFFIVCHEFVMKMFEEGFTAFARERVLDDFREKYTDGHFKKAIDAIHAAFN